MGIISALKTLYTFDGTNAVETKVSEPDRYRMLFNDLDESEKVSIMGSGLSYSPAFFSENSLCIASKHFNRILEFDPDNQTVKVEAGVKIGDLVSFLFSKGFQFSPLPGHPNISVGGCIAFDTHGKASSYIHENLLSLKIYHPDKGEFECSNSKNASVFDLTCGGMGSTGFITEATFKIQVLRSNKVVKEKIPVKNLVDAVKTMMDLKALKNQVYSWNDLSKYSSDDFGSGYIYAESVDAGENSNQSSPNSSNSKFVFLNLSSELRRSKVISKLGFLLIPFLNLCYRLAESLKPKKQILNFLEAAFPISGKEFYYFLFGKKGFREYQVLVPLDNWDTFTNDLQELCKRHKPTFTLGSLKVFSGERKYLRFSGEGVVLAINLPATENSKSFMNELDKISIKHGALVNLAKDSRLNSETIKALYKENYVKFFAELTEYDPTNRFTNQQLERIRK